MAEPYGTKILLAAFETAIVESGIHNLDYGRRGLARRASSSSGASASGARWRDTMNPPTATHMFLDAAARVMEPTRA